MFIVIWSDSIYPSPYDAPLRGPIVIPSPVFTGFRTVHRSTWSGMIQAQLAAAY